MKTTPISLCLAAVLLTATVCAQSEPPDYRAVMRTGVFGALQFNFHSGDFAVVEGGIPCATCTFENGDRMKVRFGGIVEIPLSPTVMLSGRIGFQDYSGVFQRDVRLGPVDQPTGPPVDLIVNQTFDNTLSYLSIAPGILYFPLEDMPLHFDLAAGVGVLLSKE